MLAPCKYGGPYAYNSEHPLCVPGEIHPKKGGGMKKQVPPSSEAKRRRKKYIKKESRRHIEVESISTNFATFRP